MRVIVTGSATKLGSNRTSLQCSQLAVQTISKNHDFLTQTSRRCGLSVCLSQHRNLCPFFCISSELCYQFFNLRIIYLFQCFLDRQRHRGIVNILRSQAKVNELLVFFHSAQPVELFLDEVFYSFYVVVCYALYIFNALCISFREVLINSTQ